MKLSTIEHVEKELERFTQRLAAVKEIELANLQAQKDADLNGKKYFYTASSTRSHGAVRRAALDLKEALTFITQNRDL